MEGSKPRVAGAISIGKRSGQRFPARGGGRREKGSGLDFEEWADAGEERERETEGMRRENIEDAGFDPGGCLLFQLSLEKSEGVDKSWYEI